MKQLLLILAFYSLLQTVSAMALASKYIKQIDGKYSALLNRQAQTSPFHGNGHGEAATSTSTNDTSKNSSGKNSPKKEASTESSYDKKSKKRTK